MTPRILITRRVPAAALEELRPLGARVDERAADAPISRAEFLDRLAGADAAIVMLTDRMDAEAIAAAGPALRCVANFAVGVDNLDLPALAAAGIWATNTPDVLTEATADLAWALILAVARRVVEGDALARGGGWEGWGPLQLLGMQVHGSTLGIIGAGRIGRATARRAAGFGVRVLVAEGGRGEGARRLAEEVAGARVVPLEELLGASDIVSLHCPLTAATRHLMSRARLARMKRGALLINTARGPVVDEEALADALDAGHLGGAGLDVHEFEPRLNARLAAMPRVVLLPHLGSATEATRADMARTAARNVVAVLGGRRPPHPVNEPTLPRPPRGE